MLRLPKLCTLDIDICPAIDDPALPWWSVNDAAAWDGSGLGIACSFSKPLVLPASLCLVLPMLVIERVSLGTALRLWEVEVVVVRTAGRERPRRKGSSAAA